MGIEIVYDKYDFLISFASVRPFALRRDVAEFGLIL